jgi:DSF synthase
MSALTLASVRRETRLPQRRVTTSVRQVVKPTFWVEIGPDQDTGLNNMTPALLQEFQSVFEALQNECVSTAHRNTEDASIRYAVLKSTDEEYFSLGGDLSYFRHCIQRGDASSLHAYSRQCLDLMYSFHSLLNEQIKTIALVQGRALGGGFELALSADCIIAEEHSTFAFPEIMFGLFPCTGAMGLLSNHVSPKQAERMMTESKIYTAQELKDMGIIDVVCKKGEGQRAVEDYIANHSKRLNARLKIQASRHRISPLDYSEGMRIVNDWVDLAMHLSPDERRTLDMLILMQTASGKTGLNKAA